MLAREHADWSSGGKCGRKEKMNDLHDPGLPLSRMHVRARAVAATEYHQRKKN